MDGGVDGDGRCQRDADNMGNTDTAHPNRAHTGKKDTPVRVAPTLACHRIGV